MDIVCFFECSHVPTSLLLFTAKPSAVPLRRMSQGATAARGPVWDVPSNLWLWGIKNATAVSCKPMVALDQSLALTGCKSHHQTLTPAPAKKGHMCSMGFFVGERKCFLIKFHIYFGHVNIYKKVVTYYPPEVSFEFKWDSMNSSEDSINIYWPTFCLANLHRIVT